MADLTIHDYFVSVDWLYPTAIQNIILTQRYLSPRVKHLAFWKAVLFSLMVQWSLLDCALSCGAWWDGHDQPIRHTSDSGKQAEFTNSLCLPLPTL